MTFENVTRVLAVGAHPDDVDIQAGGTLARYRQAGVEVAIAVATDGSAGHMTLSQTELAEIRRREAAAAARLIDAEFYWMGFPDDRLFEDLPTRMAFVDLIRQARPDVILTHSTGEYHPDHRVVGRLMFDASFLSGLPNVKTEFPAHPGVQPLIYFNTQNVINSVSEDFVDISETFAIKRQMMACHQSQLEWLKDHDNLSIMDKIETTSRFRGLQCGVKYAEGFRYEHSWPRRRPYRLLP